MTRSLILVAMAAGCTSTNAIEMTLMSSMQSETRGVVLYDDGQRGHAAMWGTTCEFDTLNGWLISDHDLPTEAEVMQDTYGGEVLGLSDEGIHILEGAVTFEQTDIGTRGVLESRLLSDGNVASLRIDQAGDCHAQIDGTTVDLEPEICETYTSVTTNRTDTLYVANGNEVLAVRKGGATKFADAWDLVEYDATTDLVYVANRFDTRVGGLHPDGQTAWRSETKGGIRDMDDMGARGMLTLITEDEEGGRGLLVVLDGWTGEKIAEHGTPSSDTDITLSEDGTTLAIVLPEDVYFYDVVDEDDEPKVRQTLGSERPDFVD